MASGNHLKKLNLLFVQGKKMLMTKILMNGFWQHFGELVEVPQNYSIYGSAPR